jgi:endonuclease III
VLGCIMDQGGQIRAERAWRIPYEVASALEDLDFVRFQNLTPEQVQQMFVRGNLHRYPSRMADFFYRAVQDIANRYGGNASRIWAENPPSAAVVRRFLEFGGVGPKIGTMAANILARDFRVQMSDKYSIDISVDQHVRRVSRRLGLVRPDAADVEIIYRARELSPEYPGIFDLSMWEIGRTWCGPRARRCRECYLNRFCPGAD